MLKNKEMIETIKKHIVIYIPVIIISVVFTLMNIAIGPVVFWGIIIGLLYNSSVSNTILK